jgi:hypothetical protein
MDEFTLRERLAHAKQREHDAWQDCDYANARKWARYQRYIEALIDIKGYR